MACSCGDEGRLALHRGVVRAGEVGRAAPQLRQDGGERVEHLAGRLAGGDALLVGVEGRQRLGPAGGQLAATQAVQQLGALGVGLGPGLVLLVPGSARGGTALAQRPGVLEHLCVDLERLVGVEAEDLLGRSDLVLAQRGPVRGAGALGVGGGPGDDGAEVDEAGPVGLGPRLLDGLEQRRHVLLVAVTAIGPVDVLDVPAVGGVAGRDVLAEGDRGVVLDGDLVVVVDHHEVAELLVAGERGGLGAHALLQVAVAAHHVDVVVEQALADRRLGVEQAALAPGGHGHADGVGDALAEGAGRGLDAGGVVDLGMAGGLAAPGAQGLEVLELEAEAAEEELVVEGEAGVAAGQDEPVARDPVGVGGVVAHHLLEQQVGHRRQAHRRPRVTVAHLLHGVHRQDPDGVDRLAVEIGPLQGAHAGFLSSYGVRRPTQRPALSTLPRAGDGTHTRSARPEGGVESVPACSADYTARRDGARSPARSALRRARR